VQRERNPEQIALDVRPLCLNFWLQSSRRVRITGVRRLAMPKQGIQDVKKPYSTPVLTIMERFNS